MDNSVTKKRVQSNEIDMLNGPLFKKILLFALPLAASSLLQELFNSVDVAVVGHFVGSRALAAVGSNAPVIGLLINLFMGVSMGACAIISNHIGQQDDRSIRNAISTVQLVALLSGFFLLVLGQVAARPILTWMGTPPDVLDEAVTYLRIYFLGMPFIMAFNFGAAILRSMGDTRRPLYILVMAGVVNTLLNLLFVIGFGMGVAGVAVATGIANAVSATLIIRLLRKEKEPFRLHFDKMKIHGVELSRMLRIGVPAGVQGMIFSISNVVVQSSINSYGADAIAGSSAALNFEYYCYFIIQGFNVSIRPTTGIKPLYTTIATVTMNLIVSAAIVLLNPYVTVYISYKIPPFALSVHIPDVSTSIYVEVDSKVLLGLPFCDKASGRLHHSGTPLGLHRVPYR